MNTTVCCIVTVILVPAICLAGIVSPPDSRQAQKLEAFNEVDFRVRNVGLGTSYSTVLSKFGKPLVLKREKIFDDTCGPPHTSLRIKYAGLVIRLDGDIRGRDFTVVSIEIISRQIPISPVRIGMSEREVRSILATPWQETNESGLRVLSYVTKGNDGGARLYFRAGKLMKIHWEATLC
jgi:hypothetical protein